MTPTRLAFFACLLLAFGCEHDPVLLDSHPVGGQHATGYTFQSLYLTMGDGVRIAVDVHLPEGYPDDGRHPTILEMTRYWRNRGGEVSYLIRRAVERGFAYVVMDERGTGASFGTWPSPLSQRALEDAGEVMDWITAQPWSSGRVGATGVSYPGMAAQSLASLGHPALKAIVPMSDTYDLYEDLVFPGGVFNEAFLRGWSGVIHALDRSTELDLDGTTFRLRPVDGDPSGALLEQAVAGHAANLDMYEAVEGLTFRDQAFLPGLTLDDASTLSRVHALAASGVAVYHWGSWLDGGSADGVIRQFMETPGPKRAVIGAWTHDLWRSSDPFGSRGVQANPLGEYQWEEALNFFDDILRKEKSLVDRTLRYYTLGEGRWKETDTWPVAGTETLRLYLVEGGALSPSAPSSTEGEDTHAVDFTARSSPDPRWLGPLFGDTWYESRFSEDLKLLVYETAPLTQDLEVTGYPVVSLNLTSSHSDGAVFVYLEDAGDFGRVRYVTEGVLRIIHRQTSEDPAWWDRPTPYHSYRSQDAAPLVPGEVAELSFGLHPTSVLFRAGHRIRVAIAGHDLGAFRRVPGTGIPTLSIQRNATHPSWIELPVVPR